MKVSKYLQNSGRTCFSRLFYYKATLNCFLILESADRIDPLTVKAVNANTTSPGSIKIFWKEPEVSNGPIVSYQLEYKKVGDHVMLIYIYNYKCINFKTKY